MNALGERIGGLIEAQGPISLAQFMTFALHDPALGYYAMHDPIGARGDFTTAPEISQMFGELLGLWIVQAWRDQGSPSPARLVELGPGRGTLMADVLRAATLDPKFLAGIEVVLIETSARFRKIQAEQLKTVAVSLRWLPRFDESLSGRPLFLLANEFFDALAVRQFVFTERGWRERMVGTGENGVLRFVLSPVPIALNILPERSQPHIGDLFEASPSGEVIIQQAAEVIGSAGGAALIVDYGYDGNSGFGETLQAVSQHKFASVLESPGDTDLSAHVDFAALARAAERTGARAYGPVEQGIFLRSLGIGVRADRLARANPDQRDTVAAAMERLISPAHMGTLFKTLAIVPKQAPPPPGF